MVLPSLVNSEDSRLTTKCYLLIGSNGYLQIYDAQSGKRLSHKLTLIIMNVDLRRTTDELERRIEALEADVGTESK